MSFDYRHHHGHGHGHGHDDDDSQMTSHSMHMQRSREQRRKQRQEHVDVAKNHLLSEFRAFLGWDANNKEKETGKNRTDDDDDDDDDDDIELQRHTNMMTPTGMKRARREGEDRECKYDHDHDAYSPEFSPHQIHNNVPFVVIRDSEDEVSTMQGSGSYTESPYKGSRSVEYMWKHGNGKGGVHRDGSGSGDGMETQGRVEQIGKNRKLRSGSGGKGAKAKTNATGRSKGQGRGQKDVVTNKKECIYLTMIAGSIITLTTLIVLAFVYI
mmetsp:Transcript_17119/g.25801  ORF Transcript_17119/g.25801 Transcript_17119/m.25801 type:complete len:269 (+) Transcript_17119:814-1620(+)